MIYILAGTTIFLSMMLMTAFVMSLMAEIGRAKEENRKPNYVNVFRTMKRI